jgi:uncharacterized protein (TIGR02996 family)
VSGLTTEDDFLLAMIERPDDDDLRLVFADWLEEQGDDRAQYFRKVIHPPDTVPPDDLPWQHRRGEQNVAYRDELWARGGGPGKWLSYVGWEYRQVTEKWGTWTAFYQGSLNKLGVSWADVPLAVRAAFTYRHWPRVVQYLDVIGVGIYRQRHSKKPFSHCYVRSGQEKYTPAHCRLTKRDAESQARKEAEWYRVEYVGVIEVPDGDGGPPIA